MIRSAVLIAVFALLVAGCGDSDGANPSPSTTAVRTSELDGITLPFSMLVDPASARAGQELSLTVSSSNLTGWSGGPDVQIEALVDGRWTAGWLLIADDPKTYRLDGSEPVPTIAAIGFEVGEALRVRLPSEITPGEYRACRTFASDMGDNGRLCADVFVE